ncbi:MAG TPA: CAP domain-containing protein, partial [Beijerinckiaceae bacterium]
MLPNVCLPWLAALGLGLAGCASQPPAPPPAAEPTFYRNLAARGAAVDAEAARDMISLYRRNNGLGALAIDPALQQAARAQAETMARAGSVDAGR